MNWVISLMLKLVLLVIHHITAKYNYLKIIQSLLKYGAMYNIKNKNDEISFSLSTNQNVINSLLEKLFEDAKNDNIEFISKLKKIEFDKFKKIMINTCNDQRYILFKIIKNNGYKITLRKYLKTQKYK